MEYSDTDLVAARRRVLVTGGTGQLGQALLEAFAPTYSLTVDEDWETIPLRREDWLANWLSRHEDIDLVLHAGAWTEVDAAESDVRHAVRSNVLGTRNVVASGLPIVYFSTDYVFDGETDRPYVESDEPNPLSVYGQTKLDGEREIRTGWIVRSSWLFGWTSNNFLLTMLALGAERDEVAVVDDQRGSPTFVGHLAMATRELIKQPYGLYHVAAQGDCTWADFAEAIFEEAEINYRVRRITTAELGRPAPRPAFSVLRSSKPETPKLPHWRDGLRDCLKRLALRV